MKKILAAVSLFLVMTSVSFVYAAEETLQTKIEKAVVNAIAPTNQGAIKENQVVHFTIVDRYWNPGDRYYGNDVVAANLYDFGCKAYALHANWLIVAGTCARHMDPIEDPMSTVEFKEWYITPQDKKDHFARNKNIMLVWRDKATYKGPFVNVLAVDTPHQLFTLTATHHVQINTARLGLNKVVDRTLKSGSIKTNAYGKVIFQLNEIGSDLSGTATDPLFLISSQSNEFLAGFNNGVLDYQSVQQGLKGWDGLASPNWYNISEDDLLFIKDTVKGNRPQDWEAIKKQLFFNQTQKPYFK